MIQQVRVSKSFLREHAPAKTASGRSLNLPSSSSFSSSLVSPIFPEFSQFVGFENRCCRWQCGTEPQQLHLILRDIVFLQSKMPTCNNGTEHDGFFRDFLRGDLFSCRARVTASKKQLVNVYWICNLIDCAHLLSTTIKFMRAPCLSKETRILPLSPCLDFPQSETSSWIGEPGITSHLTERGCYQC